MKKRILLIATLFGATLLAACGGGGGGETFTVASSDLAISADKTQGPALAQDISGETFTFGAVPDFGTTGTTSVVVTSTSATATPTFSIASTTGTASGALEFGSCIFRVTSSTFPSTSPMAVGKTVTVANCQLTVSTRLLVADAIARERSATLRLNTAVSSGTLVTVSINEGGQVTINGKAAGTVTLQPVTGG
ncbi:hypothetical protein LZ009_04490 [Ramlibacter sp. XY19]|uniref:hypothetical protein n=1 Tax=Ramlibacter paludis TaxID=2908000 RepID=UPI0023DCA091|nr:hypothetical protein [Ramlibacter paludis]MCG2592034.1 hypothetical protein [Ramlibacter paludis]